jgi:PAS domain S-box-containing protein
LTNTTDRHLATRLLLAAPFALLTLFGLIALLGWWTGTLVLVQPRVSDAVLPANGALCLGLLGGAVVCCLWERRTAALVMALAVALLASFTLLQGALEWERGIDDLLVRHRELIDGQQIGRMPPTLALLLALGGLLAAWFAWRSASLTRPFLLTLTGSIACAYGIVALGEDLIGLNYNETWIHFARLAPHTAAAIVVLGAGFMVLAMRDGGTLGQAGPRWLWLPVFIGGATASFAAWYALRERELGYVNSTSRIQIGSFGALLDGEANSNMGALRRMALRWNQAGGTPQEQWESDADSLISPTSAYRALMWVDSNGRTRWLWPEKGNEDMIFYLHANHPMRVAGMEAARKAAETGVPALTVVGPLVNPGREPVFAAYTPVHRRGSADGFLVGEYLYRRLIEVIDQRMALSSRYSVEVAVADPAHPAENLWLPVYSNVAAEAPADPRLRQTTIFRFYDQRISVALTPRPETILANRRFLPEQMALFAGLGFSALLGLVVHLAQAARRRQASAELTSAQLRAENEERRRIEARLKVTDERLNLALDSTQIGVYEWDVPSGRVIYSPSVWTSLGYDPAVMPATAEAWGSLIHPEDQARFQAALEAHFSNATPLFELEYRVRGADGQWQWIFARAKCVAVNTDRQPLRVIGTCQNITARKRAEEALSTVQAESRKLSLVASRTDNPVLILSREGHIEWVNTSFERISEYSLGEIAGRSLLDLLASPDTDAGALDRVTNAMLRGEPVATEVMHLAKSGRRYILRLDLQPVHGAGGRLENIIGLATDMTARVEVEQTLRRAKAEADSASRAKSEFLASMSHEIRTPMNGVIGMTSLLLDTKLDPEQREFVNTIRTSGDALLSIINEILDFSKIESGKMELEQQPFDLVQCLEDALDIFSLQAGAKGIELAYSLDPAVPRYIEGDITRLRQVIVNLLNNAVKFTPAGFVTVEVRLAAGSTRKPGGNVLLDFFVTDTGIGIPAERRHLLFQPLSQVDSSTTRKFGGTGLGLVICDRLCQLMGGSIDVESEAGKGSRFRFSIQTQAVEDVPEPTRPPFSLRLAGSPVLAVDDHPVNRASLQHALSAVGFKPLVVATGREFLDQLARQRPLLAVIDWVLPGESAEELVARVRAAHANLPIIVLSPATEVAQRVSSTDPLVVRVPKPVKPSALLEHIVRLTGAPATGLTQPPLTSAESRPPIAGAIPLEVLLVEDNPVNQKVALRFLSKLGYQAAAAANGLEAVAMATKHNFNIIFMDVQMPEMDGFAATGEIRSRLPVNRQPVIVALTANAIAGDRERCILAGMDDYLTKPIKLDDVEQIIVRHFGPNAKSRGQL